MFTDGPGMECYIQAENKDVSGLHKSRAAIVRLNYLFVFVM